MALSGYGKGGVKTKNQYRKIQTVLCILLVLCVLLAGTVGFFLGANLAVERTAHINPSYPREDLSSVALHETLSEEDYNFLYRQTGLSKTGVKSVEKLASSRAEFLARLLQFQDALYSEGEIRHEILGPITQRDLFYVERGGVMTAFTAPIVPLQDGDVLVSSVCHTLGWRNGHAALVSSAATNTVFESVGPGDYSAPTLGGARWFRDSANFILLRLKDECRDLCDPAKVASDALKNLSDVPYSIAVGIFHQKDQGITPNYTNCSHLVWQAYKNFGLDIDSDGGPVVTARDIANSPYFEVVQVYGFDPLVLW